MGSSTPTEPGWYAVRVEDVGEVAEWGPRIPEASELTGDTVRDVLIWLEGQVGHTLSEKTLAATRGLMGIAPPDPDITGDEMTTGYEADMAEDPCEPPMGYTVHDHPDRPHCWWWEADGAGVHHRSKPAAAAAAKRHRSAVLASARPQAATATDDVNAREAAAEAWQSEVTKNTVTREHYDAGWRAGLAHGRARPQGGGAGPSDYELDAECTCFEPADAADVDCPVHGTAKHPSGAHKVTLNAEWSPPVGGEPLHVQLHREFGFIEQPPGASVDYVLDAMARLLRIEQETVAGLRAARDEPVSLPEGAQLLDGPPDYVCIDSTHLDQWAIGAEWLDDDDERNCIWISTRGRLIVDTESDYGHDPPGVDLVRAVLARAEDVTDE